MSCNRADARLSNCVWDSFRFECGCSCMVREPLRTSPLAAGPKPLDCEDPTVVNALTISGKVIMRLRTTSATSLVCSSVEPGGNSTFTTE